MKPTFHLDYSAPLTFGTLTTPRFPVRHYFRHFLPFFAPAWSRSGPGQTDVCGVRWDLPQSLWVRDRGFIGRSVHFCYLRGQFREIVQSQVFPTCLKKTIIEEKLCCSFVVSVIKSFFKMSCTDFYYLLKIKILLFQVQKYLFHWQINFEAQSKVKLSYIEKHHQIFKIFIPQLSQTCVWKIILGLL